VTPSILAKPIESQTAEITQLFLSQPLRPQNCESDVDISASQAIEGPVNTAAAAPGWISWADLGSGIYIARALSVSITRTGI
jgi:hypothetical protein